MNLSQSLVGKARYRSKLLIMMIACNIALSQFYYGYINNSFATLDINTMVEVYSIPLSKGTASGVVNGIVPLCSIFGGLINYYIVSRISRRNIVLLTNVVAIMAGLIIFIPNFYTLMFGRLLQGMCIGCYITMAPLMIREIAPTQIAGAIGSISQIFMIGGVSFACIFQYVLSQSMDDLECRITWKYVMGFPLLTLIFQSLVLLYIFPYETPKYLITIGDNEGARRLINILYKDNYLEEIEMEKVEDMKAKKKHDEELAQLDNQLYGGHSIILKLKSNAGIMMIILTIMQQMTGINPVSVYGHQVAKNSVQSVRYMVPSIINTIQLVGTLKSSYLLHHYGRKHLFVYGSLGIAISLLILYFGLVIQDFNKGFGTFLVLFGLSLFSYIFGMTIAPCTWLYLSEIVDPELMPYAVISNRFTAFVSVLTFPIITSDIFGGDSSPLFFFFATLMFIYFWFTRKYIIETKGKEEKQIRLEFKEMRWKN